MADQQMVDVGPDDPRLADAAPLLQDLDGIDLEALRRTYEEGHAAGLRLTSLYVAGDCVAVAAWRVMATLQWGRKLHVEDLVTCRETRSRGHGTLLLDELQRRGRAAGCSVMDLDSGVQRCRAHRFYTRNGFDITKHHFHRDLV